MRLRGTSSQKYGSIARFEWDLGGMGSFTETSSGDTAVQVPSEPGSYSCIFKVTDDDGNTALDTLRIQVVADPPVAAAGKDTSATINDTLALHGRGSDKFGRVVKWEWNIGPGRQFVEAPNGDTSMITRATPGFDTLVLRITDDDGITAMDTLVVAVLLDPPIALAGKDTSLTVSDSLVLEGTGRDAMGRIVKREWNIGANREFVDVPGGKAAIQLGSLVGFEAYLLRVTDDDGNTALDTLRVPVHNDVPVLKLTSSLRPLSQGGGYQLTSLVNDMGRIVKWEWSTDTSGTFVERSRGDTGIVPRVPANGMLVCRLRVTDDDGNMSIASTEVAASNWTYVDQRGKLGSAAGFGNRIFALDMEAGPRLSEYDPLAGTWTPFGDVNHPEKVVTGNQRLFTVGTQGLLEYDFIFKAYKKYADMDNTFATYSAAYQDGWVFVAGGGLVGLGSNPWTDYRGAVSRRFVGFNLSINAWKDLADLPLPLYGAQMASVDGKLYILGGRVGAPEWANDKGNLRVFSYDFLSNSWTEKALLPASISTTYPPASWSTVVNGKIYAGDRDRTLEYDPQLDRWSEKSPLLFKKPATWIRPCRYWRARMDASKRLTWKCPTNRSTNPLKSLAISSRPLRVHLAGPMWGIGGLTSDSADTKKLLMWIRTPPYNVGGTPANKEMEDLADKVEAADSAVWASWSQEQRRKFISDWIKKERRRIPTYANCGNKFLLPE